MVAVGTRVAPCPPHGSRRAALPHRALALGSDARSRPAYPVQRCIQVRLALSPEPGLLSRISLGQVPSLQALRRERLPARLVRALPRYYGPVRLPAAVHRGLAPFGFSARTPRTARGQRRDLPGSAQDVCVRAWGLRPRGVRMRLAMAAHPVWPSEQRNAVGTPDKTISRLNTQPARSPANACTAALRPKRHGAGPVWLATPSLCKTLTRYTLPAWPGAVSYPSHRSCLSYLARARSP